jgi:mutator protein MutT
MRTPSPTPIAIVLVQHAGRVLIGRRPPEVPLAGYWEFPGGKVQPGETFREAAARECREETGLEVCLGEEYQTVVHAYAHGQLTLHFFTATPQDPSQSPAAPFRWVPVAELGDYPFPPANAEVVARLLKDVGRRAY